jgi:quercetin dioxygenase-like cupin family protein
MRSVQRAAMALAVALTAGLAGAAIVAQSPAKPAGPAKPAAPAKPAGAAQPAAAATSATAKDGLLMKSALFTWDSVPETATEQGARRTVFAAPTATLDELEHHTTTLKPGGSPHPPHTHQNEEIIIVKSGTVEGYVNGEWKTAPEGSLLFFASMVPHTVRNTSDKPATYFVLNWAARGTKPKKAEGQ